MRRATEKYQSTAGLVGALLHLDPESLDVKITNPIILGQSFANKDFVLDVNILINHEIKLILEMQIINYHNWKERSLSYLCQGDDYINVVPVIQIGFLDTDKLRMSVIELNHIELATEEDCLYEIDKWETFSNWKYGRI